MPKRLVNRLKYRVERFVVHGAFNRLLIIAVMLLLVSVAGGLIVHLGSDQFPSLAGAIWWAFLRLTDPGYLGDDSGTLVRVVSTVITILGYVIFLGALIAIMTQWLNETMHELGRGLTPIAAKDHILILGWTNRTDTIVQELLLSEGRLRRFLKRHGTGRLRIVLLIDDVTEAIIHELRDRLGKYWSTRRIVLRSGTPLRLDHLRRVDFLNASAILLPSGEFDGATPSSADETTIKALLSTSSFARDLDLGEMPLMVAEIADARKIPIARRAYGGPIEIIAADLVISRLIVQNVRHGGLSFVYTELLTHTAGNEIYVRRAPDTAGRTFGSIIPSFEHGVLIGITRWAGSQWVPHLNPPLDFMIEPDDRLVVIAPSYDKSLPQRFADAGVDVTPATGASPSQGPSSADGRRRRVLLLGWNHKIPALVSEFESYDDEEVDLDIVSLRPVDERERLLSRYDVRMERTRVTMIDRDFTSPTDLKALDPASYDNVVLLASDWLDTEEESDARTILGYLILQQTLEGHDERPHVLIELMDAENVPLFQPKAREVLISPLVLSHMLTQVALRRELAGVFDELFGAGGAEITFLRPSALGLGGREIEFSEAQTAVSAAGSVALGFRIHSDRNGKRGGVYLNPRRSRRWNLTDDDELIVLVSGT